VAGVTLPLPGGGERCRRSAVMAVVYWCQRTHRSGVADSREWRRATLRLRDESEFAVDTYRVLEPSILVGRVACAQVAQSGVKSSRYLRLAGED
jgi:hypothetical protein